MSRISELAETFKQTSKEQAASIEIELQSAMQQHASAIKSDLQRMRNEIEGSTRALSETVKEELTATLHGRLRRAVMWLWIAASIGILTASGTFYLTTIQTQRIIEQQSRVEELRESGANINQCRKDSGLVPCVEVIRTARGWQTENEGTVFMEIAQ